MASGKAVWRISRKTVWKSRKGYLAAAKRWEEMKWAELTCPFCQGRGRDPYGVLSHLSKCPVCHGRKTVRVTEPYETCSACGGTGLYFRTRTYCGRCKGKGVVPVRMRKEAWQID